MSRHTLTLNKAEKEGSYMCLQALREDESY